MLLTGINSIKLDHRQWYVSRRSEGLPTFIICLCTSGHIPVIRIQVLDFIMHASQGKLETTSSTSYKGVLCRPVWIL